MIITDNISPRGTLEYVVFKHDQPIEYVVDHNLVVNAGRNMLARLIAGEPSAAPIKYIAFGSGTAVEDLTDLQLENQLNIELTSYTVSGNEVIFYWTLGVNDGNNMDITEFGLVANDGTLITHQVRGKVIGKAPDMRIEGKYILHF